MARRGSTSIANRLSRGGAVITGTPFTFAAWYKAITLPSVDANAGHAILAITDTATDDNFFGLFGRAADDLFRFSAQKGGLPLRSAVSTTPITVGQWIHVCGVAASATDRRIYINGVDEGQSIVSTIPAGLDQTNMFVTQISSGIFSPANADLAEAGVWGVALTANEVATLATPGILPSDVRPLNLKMYPDLMLALSPEPDRSSNGNALFVTGSLPQSDHVPTVITPGSLAALKALKAEISNDPEGLGYGVGTIPYGPLTEWKGDQVIADLINAKNLFIDRLHPETHVLVGSMEFAWYDGLTPDKQEYFTLQTGFETWLMTAASKLLLTGAQPAVNGVAGASDPTDSFWLAADQTAAIAAMLPLIEVPGSRAEVLWGEDRIISAGQVGGAVSA